MSTAGVEAADARTVIEREFTSALAPGFAEAFASLDGAGIVWALLRGHDDFEEPEQDVDLLVHPRDLPRLGATLHRASFIEVPTVGRATHRFFVAYEQEIDRWLQLDVVTELAFGPGFFARSSSALRALGRRVRKHQLWLLAPNDRFWVLLLHCLLDRGDVRESHSRELRRLASTARADGELADFFESYAPPPADAAWAIDCARRSDWESLLAVRKTTLLRAARRAPLSSLLRLGFARLGRVSRSAHRAIYHRGPRVALLGPDGSGKSTLSAGLRDSYFFPVSTYYAGLSKRQPGARRLPPGFRLVGLLARLRVRSLSARLQQLRGRTVVFDRYVYDALLQPAPTQAHRFRRWLLAHACPRADIALLLDVTGDEMERRKGEFPAAVLEEQRARFLLLQRRLPELVVIDGRADADAVRRVAIRLLWDRYRLSAAWRLRS